MRDRFSLPRLIAYAMGNAGFGITGQIVVGIGIYYYLPPGDVPDLRPLVSEEMFLGVLTAYGLARLIGGVFDSLADPFVGHWSDRSRSRLGRRRSFMIYGIVPMVAVPAWLFWPPGAPGSQANFAFLAFGLALYYVFFTAYVAPYLALMPEIARTERERVDLARIFAAVGAPIGVLLGPAWTFSVQAGRDAGLGSEASIRIVVVALSVLAFLLCLAPILAVDERRLEHSVRSDLSFRAAITLTVRNRPFLIYLMAQILFIVGINMVGPLAPYLTEVVLGRDLRFAALLGLVPVLPAIVSFVYAHRLVEWLGTKRMMVIAVAIVGSVLCLLGLLRPDVPGGPNDVWNLAVICSVLALIGPTIAAFSILPNVIIGQLIDRDEAMTGANRSAMFFGAQGLLTKWAYAFSAVVLSYLFVEFGNSQEEPLGVILVGPVGGVLCLAGALLYALYPEQQVLEEGAAVRASDP